MNAPSLLFSFWVTRHEFGQTSLRLRSWPKSAGVRNTSSNLAVGGIVELATDHSHDVGYFDLAEFRFCFVKGTHGEPKIFHSALDQSMGTVPVGRDCLKASMEV